MISLIKKMFESYLHEKTCKEIITPELYSILKYHRIEMLLLDKNNRFSFTKKDNAIELLKKKVIISNKNKRYIDEMLNLSIAFNCESINYVFLKGAAMILNEYKEIYYRYFSDIDILVDYSDIQKVENILYKQGYIQGEVIEGKINKANRKDILYQRLHTHEIYNMVKLDKEIHEINVDINFMFTWHGLNKETKKLLLGNFIQYIMNISKKEVACSIFNNDLQFVHLCLHLYNEAVYFMLDNQYINGTDPKELLLFRLLDILIIYTNGINMENIYSLVNSLNCIYKIEYVVSLIEIIMGIEYISDFNQYFKSNTKSLNYFYNPKGDAIEWPININERLFDFKSKKRALTKLKNEGYV